MFVNILENKGEKKCKEKKHLHSGYQYEITKEPNHAVEWEDKTVVEQMLT